MTGESGDQRHNVLSIVDEAFTLLILASVVVGLMSFTSKYASADCSNTAHGNTFQSTTPKDVVGAVNRLMADKRRAVALRDI